MNAHKVIADAIDAAQGQYGEALAYEVLESLKDQGYAVVELPKPEPSGVTGQREWPVPIICTLTGQLRTGSRGGAVFIRHSDGRIALDGIPTPLPSADDARRTAAALLAAALQVETGDKQ
ncbi:hypothetical protein [Mycobacteroides chelonae]|uniref:hypothetical protein n=1 Tax=Mycobacteroides chelonae TaxID=1774 RepID=UPI0008A8A0A9|nr:hypothetical protein [Mycobacteroides chelonae]OHU64048.1 hypothetical protein BKG85_11510 [Mycobacteroides chelonae]